MTEPRAVLVTTSDRRLRAAVASFVDPLDLQVVDSDDDREVVAALYDARGQSLDDWSAWLLARDVGAGTVAVATDQEQARQLLEAGAQDVVLDPDEAGLRLWYRARPETAPVLDPRFRKLIRHDVRSPLAVILGQAEILSLELGGSLTDRQRRSVEAIDRQAEQLRDLLDALSDTLEPWWDLG